MQLEMLGWGGNWCSVAVGQWSAVGTGVCVQLPTVACQAARAVTMEAAVRAETAPSLLHVGRGSPAFVG